MDLIAIARVSTARANNKGDIEPVYLQPLEYR